MTDYSRDALRSVLAPLAEECAGLSLEPARREYFARATPLFDSRRDTFVTDLKSFEPARAGLATLDRVQAQYGEPEARRIALKVAFEILASVTPAAATDPILKRLAEEIETPTWRWFGVANLSHLRGDEPTYRLDPSTTIQGRDPSVFEALGIPEAIRALEDEWHRHPFGSYVLIVESALQKVPDNVVLTGPGLWEAAQRALLALRLAAPGDINIGALFSFRSTPFEFALGGLSSSFGASSPTFGFFSDYRMSPEVVAEYKRTHTTLAKFDAIPEKARRKVVRALAYFGAIYSGSTPNDRFVDSISALEAVLGSDSESTFKLAFRLASLLAGDDTERSTLFEFFRRAYDARSKVVHGDEIKQRHAEILGEEALLRAHTRRLLRGCLQIVRATTIDALLEHLDARLLSSVERDKIRKQLWPDGV